MAALRILSVAVASGRAGYVFFDGPTLIDWGITVRAVRSATELAGFIQALINELKPDVVVTEKCDTGSKKGRRSRNLIRAVAETASHNTVLDVAVPRPRIHPSKYEEAAQLAKRYPEIAGYLPTKKRRIFDFEPRSMILFEALALFEAVQFGPPHHLAAELG